MGKDRRKWIIVEIGWWIYGRVLTFCSLLPAKEVLRLFFFLIRPHEILISQIYCISLYILYVYMCLIHKRVRFFCLLKSFHPQILTRAINNGAENLKWWEVQSRGGVVSQGRSHGQETRASLWDRRVALVGEAWVRPWKGRKMCRPLLQGEQVPGGQDSQGPGREALKEVKLHLVGRPLRPPVNGHWKAIQLLHQECLWDNSMATPVSVNTQEKMVRIHLPHRCSLQ